MEKPNQPTFQGSQDSGESCSFFQAMQQICHNNLKWSATSSALNLGTVDGPTADKATIRRDGVSLTPQQIDAVKVSNATEAANKSKASQTNSDTDLKNTKSPMLIGVVVMVLAYACAKTTLVPTSIADVNELAYIPIIGTAIYMGIISGYIPSPLYEHGERWPREYAIAQVVFLVLTATRLTRGEAEHDSEDEDKYEYERNIEELADFTHLMGTSLWDMFYRADSDGFLGICWSLLDDYYQCIIFVVVLKLLTNRYEHLGKVDATKHLPLSLVFARNCVLHIAIRSWSISEDTHDPEGDTYKFC